MTQEDKQLLLQDLCARLPYEPKVYWENCNYGDKIKNVVSIDIFGIINDEFSVEECKPYLRPMSSMTEEEKEELVDFGLAYWDNGKYTDEYGHTIIYDGKKIQLLPDIETYYWLNKKMFDYRGLIPKGLAIEVTKENNPYK